jgi:two-component system NtrC family response regulator
MVPDSGLSIDDVERAAIAFALERTRGNRTQAARFLSLSRSALLYRMRKHGILVPHQV